MSAVLDAFKESALWSKEWGLPLVPEHNQPHLYSAYCMKVMRGAGLTAMENLELRQRFKEFHDACRVRLGLYHRWPGGRGGLMSHDELLGLSYLEEQNARDIVAYLSITDGIYANEPVPFPDRADVYRIGWVKPALTACAGPWLALRSQAYLAALIVWDALTWRQGDEGGRLRFWLVEEKIRERGHWLAGFAFKFWTHRMNEKGMSPKRCFEGYLSNHPQLRAYAPTHF